MTRLFDWLPCVTVALPVSLSTLMLHSVADCNSFCGTLISRCLLQPTLLANRASVSFMSLWLTFFIFPVADVFIEDSPIDRCRDEIGRKWISSTISPWDFFKLDLYFLQRGSQVYDSYTFCSAR